MKQPVTIEQTTKRWKGIKLMGWLMVLTAMPIAVSGGGNMGLAMATAGVVCIISAGLGAWWENG